MNTIFWFENPMGRYHLGNTDVDVRVILKWISGK
jgi:hypothetical protein